METDQLRRTARMVKGISRRVVVVDAPEHRFLNRPSSSSAMTLQERGSPPRELVEEARRVAHNYAPSGTSRFSNRWRTLNPHCIHPDRRRDHRPCLAHRGAGLKKARSLFERERVFCVKIICAAWPSASPWPRGQQLSRRPHRQTGKPENCLRTSSKGSTA